MKKILILILIILLQLSNCVIQEKSPAALTVNNAAKSIVMKERIIKNIASPYIDISGSDINKIPGMYIICISQNQIIKLGLGTTKIGFSNNPTGDTVFPIGSLSKIISSYILAEKVVNQELSLNTKLADILNDIDGIDPRISLRHLVTHSSGLPNFPGNLTDFRDEDNDGENDSVFWSPARNYTEELLIDLLKNNILEAPPGYEIQYSNLGCGLLAYGLEKNENVDNYNDLLESTFVNWLNLTQTGSNDPDFVNSVKYNLSGRYGIKNNTLISVPIPDMGIMAGSGEILSCGNDITEFLKILLNYGNPDLQDTNEEYHKPLRTVDQNTKIGYAMKIGNSIHGNIYSKDGVTFGSSSYIYWCPDASFGIAILSNKGNAEEILSSICRQVFFRLN